MTSPTATASLPAALSQAGVSTNAAGVLCRHYPDAHPVAFVAGLHACAQAIMLLVPPALVPTAEPWASIGQALAGATPNDLEDAFENALAPLPFDLQTAVSEAIQQHASAVQSPQTKAARSSHRAKSEQYLRALTRLGYSFRVNDLNDVIEVNGEPISDGLAARIRVDMRDVGLESMKFMEDVYMAEAFRNRYHPIREYFNSLQYDGAPHIERLASHFSDRDGVFPTWLKRFLVGSVAKVYQAEQNYTLVLDGNQDLGKSTFVRWLASPRPEYFVESSIYPEDKDAYVRLASTWIWEISEFGSTTRKADREALKSFLTTRTVTVRKAYGRFDMVKPAQASFIATVNNESGILNDPTGSRRFLIACLTGIDWNYSRAVDPHQVWAEAHALYLAGEPWRLEPAELQAASKVNEQYEVEDPIEGLLKKYFHVDPGDTRVWTSTVDILIRLESNGLRGGNTRQNSMALAAVGTKLGVTKKKRRNANGQLVWGYLGVTPL